MRSILFTFLLSLPILLQAQPQVELEQIASGFSSPVEITHAGDSRLFIVERGGKIKIIDSDGSVLSTPFLDIDDRVFSFGGQGEIGLLGLAFHPDYANNGYFYVHYTNTNEDSNISRFQVLPFSPNVADENTEEVLMTIEQPYLNHNGGCLRFGPDGYLYIGLGDGGSAGDPENRAQNSQSFLGKMLRIDIDNGLPYSIPADNPFVNDPNTQDAIWALGLRNPWRFSFDKLTGDMWIGDVGQGNWEEIDFQSANSTGGENYGWRCYEGDNPYNTSGCESAENYQTPAYAYNHNGFTHCSVTGGHVYRGGEYEDMQGYYFYADYCSGKMWAMQEQSGGTFTNDEVGNFPGYDISTFGEGLDGSLYLARLGNGRIYKLVSAACTGFSASGTTIDETCGGDSDGAVDVMVTGGTMPLDFEWSNNAISQDIINISAGVYTLTISDDNGCNIIQNFEVVSGTPSNPSIEANSATNFCEGDLVVLNAYDLPDGYGYQWFKDGNILMDENDQSLTVDASGQYYVVVTGDVCGPVTGTSNWITVDVEETPTQPFLEADGDLMFCNGESVTLSTISDTPDGYTIQWFIGGTLLPGENGTSLTVSSSGSYYAIYDGNCPTPTSNWATVEVQTTAPQATFNFPGTGTFCEGESLNLIAASAPVGFDYQWYLNDELIDGAINQTLNVSEGGDYHVLYTGDCLTPGINAQSISVSPLPEVPVLTISEDSILASSGGEIYQWSLNGVVIGNTMDNFLLPAEDGTYSVECFNAEGCSSMSEPIEYIISGLEEIGAESLEINPNPFKRKVSIELEWTAPTNMEIVLFNSAGEQVYFMKEQADGIWNRTLDLENLASGIYLLNITTEKGSLSRRLIKQ